MKLLVVVSVLVAYVFFGVITWRLVEYTCRHRLRFSEVDAAVWAGIFAASWPVSLPLALICSYPFQWALRVGDWLVDKQKKTAKLREERKKKMENELKSALGIN